jgi:hypothetical protein
MDPDDAICDALVTYINSLRTQMPSPLMLMCNARKPEDPSAELLQEHELIQVLFIPSGEEEVKIGRSGQATETFIVTMLVVRQLTVEFTRERLSKFVRALKDNIRGRRMAGYVYSFAETVSKFDPDRLHDNKQFVSAVKFHYMGTANV